MRMIFLGPPGVGKGTHAEKIAREFGIIKISTGEIFREEVKSGTELGKKLNEYMEKGILVPDDMTTEILKKRLGQEDCQKGFILDGYPRNIDQTEALNGITKLNLVVNMVASHETIIARISNRLTCRNCQAIYNTLFVKPKREGVCDRCGGELYQRDDQKPEVVKERLEVYEEETAPLIDYYKNKGILIDVSAEGEVEVVHKRLLKAIKEYNSRKS